MKFLVALACLFAAASAKPELVAPLAYNYAYGTPYAYTYATPYASAHLTAAHIATPVAHTAIATPVAHAVATPVVAAVEKTQYHAQDTLGQASYGHSEPLQAHNAVQDAAGNKVGSYSYVAPNGQVFSTNYVADSLGYRVATNALPTGPNVVPVAPAETPEVYAARVAHLEAHALARSRSRRSVAAYAPLGYSAAYTTPFVHSAYTSHYSTPAVYSNVYSTPAHAYSYVY